MKKSHIIATGIKVPLDFLASLGGLLLAYSIRTTTDLIPGIQLETIYIPEFYEFLGFSVAAASSFVLFAALNGLYRMKVKRPLRREVARVAYTSLVWILAIIAYFFIIRQFFYSRLVLIYSFVFTIVFASLLRSMVSGVQTMLHKRGIGRSRVLLLGKNAISTKLEKLLKDQHEVELLGTLPVRSLSEKELTSYAPDEVIQTKHDLAESSTNLVVTWCRQNHVRYRVVPDVLELQLTNVDVEWKQGLPILELKPTPLDGWGRIVKRLFDIVGALAATIVLSPFIIGTALAVWIQMGSFKHIIFKQRRYGYKGNLFMFYKFQSMRVGASKEHAALMNKAAGERKGLLKIKDDPRVTPVGRFIRKTSLDELSQLWNVLNGTMSLVGPRPHMPEEIDRVTKDYQRVLSIKPGITGLAQVNGRSTNSFDDEMKLDLAYLESWSLWLDIVILWKTVWKIVKRSDAS